MSCDADAIAIANAIAPTTQIASGRVADASQHEPERRERHLT